MNIIIFLAIFAALMFLLHALTRRDPAADFTRREMAGELTPDEVAELDAEERANHERRTSMKDVVFFERR